METTKLFRQDAGRWRVVAVVFIVLSVILAITAISLAVVLHRVSTEASKGTSDGGEETDDIDVSDSDNPSVFHDLTQKELAAIQNFVYSNTELNVVPQHRAAVNESYIFIMDLHLPPKSDVLGFIDEKAKKPNREATVIVFRGDKSPPVVEEYIVGPLPNPNYIRLRVEAKRPNPIMFNYRPYGSVEFIHLYYTLVPEIDRKLRVLLAESYDAGLVYPECDLKCLFSVPSPIGSGVLGENVRKFWLTMYHSVEFLTLHPVGLSILIIQNATDPIHYFAGDAVYDGQRFSSVDELAMKYSSGELIKHKVPFPSKTRDLFSSLNLRGKPVPEIPKRPPKLFEPDGKRYKISHRHVEYMQWSFHFRMSAIAGPQIYDVRFNNERLAYEVGLQEIAVLYSGHSPAHMTSDFVDSTELLGLQSFGLVPGADCPDTSTFVDKYYLRETTLKPTKASNTFCIFEENTGFPLRRHASYGAFYGNFYSGMLDSSLVLRSAMTIGNYDYIVDYVFHQNGALQIRTAATGYLFSSFYKPEERDYGFRLHDSMVGNIHQHLFHFKMDLDIHGTKNRYETLDISATEVKNDYSTSNATYWQTKFKRDLKQSELDAAYNFDFKHPKYHFVHNERVKTDQMKISGYRIHVEGMTHQPLPHNKGNEATLSWTRHQLVTTKFKDDERHSSSFYGMFDSLNPVVNFSRFLADDENIVDQDLVVWATVGLHHIPHTEDLPVTPTPGGHLGIYLLPYNYFKECPSMSSRDAIRIEPKSPEMPSNGIRIERYGNSNQNTCPSESFGDEEIEENIAKLFT